jgi:hypothetical protein
MTPPPPASSARRSWSARRMDRHLAGIDLDDERATEFVTNLHERLEQWLMSVGRIAGLSFRRMHQMEVSSRRNLAHGGSLDHVSRARGRRRRPRRLRSGSALRHPFKLATRREQFPKLLAGQCPGIL